MASHFVLISYVAFLKTGCRLKQQDFRRHGFCPANGKRLFEQIVGNTLQEGQPFGADFTGLRGSFDGAAGFGAVGAVVEAALPDEVAHVGEVLQQVGGLKVVQPEFLQTWGVDQLGFFV